MGFFSTVFGICGFGVGVSAGAVVGYFFFIYFQPTHVKGIDVKPIVEQDSESLQKMISEIPLWVKNPDYDRVDWLNKFIESMWPYLDKAICQTIKDVAKPIIAEQIPNYNINSVEFEVLTLGSLPPTFQGMKVYETDDKELIMEPCLRWAGNPNVIVSVHAYGLKATVQLVDLQVFAAPRITLKPLVSSFPCFSNIFVSLMEKPHVDFGLKVLGADLMSIPGVHILVQEIIKDKVAEMYLWPKTLVVPMMDPIEAMKRPIGLLHVKMLRGYKLLKKDIFGKSDPYVKLKLTGDNFPSKKTAVKRNTLNPEWNEEFNITVKDLSSQVLELTCNDYNKVGKHDYIGMNVVSLKDLPPNEKKAMTIELLKTKDQSDIQNDKSRGQILLELMYKPFKEDVFENYDDGDDNSGKIENAPPQATPEGGGLLIVTIHEANDVEGKHHTNPYARIIFKGERKKTKHLRKNRDPRWEEEFEYICNKPPTDDKIRIEVFSKPSSSIGIHSKENLGYVELNLADVVNNRRINETYNLIDSKNGRIQIEMRWSAS